MIGWHLPCPSPGGWAAWAFRLRLLAACKAATAGSPCGSPQWLSRDRPLVLLGCLTGASCSHPCWLAAREHVEPGSLAWAESPFQTRPGVRCLSLHAAANRVNGAWAAYAHCAAWGVLGSPVSGDFGQDGLEPAWGVCMSPHGRLRGRWAGRHRGCGRHRGYGTHRGAGGSHRGSVVVPVTCDMLPMSRRQ